MTFFPDGYDEDVAKRLYRNSVYGWDGAGEYETAERRDSGWNEYLQRELDPNQLCPNCGIEAYLCLCCPDCGSTNLFCFCGGRSNEATPFQRQEMENSSHGAGAITEYAPPLPKNPYTIHEPSGMTTREFQDPLTVSGKDDAAAGQTTTLMEPPLQTLDLPQLGNQTELGEIAYAGTDNEVAQLLNGLASGGGGQSHAFADFWQPNTLDPAYAPHLQGNNNNSAYLSGSYTNQPQAAANFDDDEADPDNARAYAKLVFADGDLFITTHDVILGRNMQRFEQMMRRKKQERRAREELDTYRKEPSQPSQPGDEDQQNDPSTSSQSLEGRPAPPSNFSEHGGPVWYPPHSDDEVDMQPARPRRRVSHFSKSSSTTSVAPANLHTGMISDLSNGFDEPPKRTTAFIPIHTQIPEDIAKISKEHLMLSFNFEEQQWELKVVGNRAFINDQLFEKGTVIPLQHDDDILIATIPIRFKLPDNFRNSPGLSRGTFSKHSNEASDEDESEDGAEQVSMSAVRRLSNALGGDDSESGEEDEAAQTTRRGRPKKTQLKIKTKLDNKKIGKTTKGLKSGAGKKSKAQATREIPSESPASPEKKKGQDAKGSKKEDADASKAEASAPPDAPFIKPGSVLENIPVEELPEKRKGPGRPPKEGNVSKRDTQLASKLKKEFEKRGEEPPAFKELVDMVRIESKRKERQARMEANGTLEPGQEVLPSIEDDAAGLAALADGKSRLDDGATEQAKRSSPKPKRPVRAISPIKPESECTAEELKKPDHTYVHIIDQILSEHHSGVADLQEIYELIMKKYPYFKYRQSTMGWQSSVRHNLLQAARFKDVGKSGKGKLWTIDPDIPLEKEKKRRATPPPGQRGMTGQPQYGQGQYGNLYGQQRPNGPPPAGASGYYSPYGQSGQHAQSGYMPPSGASHPATYAQGQYTRYPQQQQNGHAHTPQPRPWDSLVSEIVAFNGRHAAQFTSDPAEQARQAGLCQDIISYLSPCFSGQTPGNAELTKVKDSDAKPLFGQLAALFQRHKADIKIPNPWQDAAPTPTDNSGVAGVEQDQGAQASKTEDATFNDKEEEGSAIAYETQTSAEQAQLGATAASTAAKRAGESLEEERETKRVKD